MNEEIIEKEDINSKAVYLKIDVALHKKATEYASLTGRSIKGLCEYFLLKGLKEAGYDVDVI